jgi:putative cardiolipin synthase
MTYLKYAFFLLVFIACSSKDETATEHTDFCDQIHRDSTTSKAQELAGLDSLMQEKTGVYVLEDGAGSMVARAWLTEYAEKSIDIQYFIFSTDNIGLIAIDYLVRAADRGVKVRILVDDIMVDAELSDILMVQGHENIEIKIYNPGANLGKSIFSKIKNLTTDFRGFNQRMHNKTFIVDDEIVITGGRNIADEYFDFDHEYNFRDRDILLMGQGSKQVSDSFEEFWNSELSVPVEGLAEADDMKELDPVSYEMLHQYACDPENFWPQVRERITRLPSVFKELQGSGGIVWLDSIIYISDDPGKNAETAGLGGGGKSTEALIKLIAAAEKSIDIQSPYLVTTELSRGLFREAVERGVEVRILTNSMASTDNMEAFSGYQRDREELLATGLRIFEYRPDARERYDIMTSALQKSIDFTPIFGLHAKSMVIDGITTVIGTFNLDPRSANLNTECLTIVNSAAITAGVLAGMETEFQPENSWETTFDFNPDHLASTGKQIKTWTRKAVPKGIL